MVAHRWLREPEWFRQVADARLTVRVSAKDAEQAEPRRVSEHPKGSSQSLGCRFIERLRQQLWTAGGVDRLDQSHAAILTAVDTSVNVSTHIDTTGKEVTQDGDVLRPAWGVLPTGLLLDLDRLAFGGGVWPTPARTRGWGSCKD